MSKPHKPVSSSVVIARLLCSQGYTNWVGKKILEYARNKILSQRDIRKFDRLRTELRVLAQGMNEGERAVLGKFIAYEKRIGFETGLRVGIASSLAVNEPREAPSEDELITEAREAGTE